MTIFLTIIGILTALAGLILYIRSRRRRQYRHFILQKTQRVAKLQERLETGPEPDSHDILPYAASPATRLLTYHLLQHFDRKHLFPQYLNTQVKAAESHLANWLEFPTELGAIPQEMEHLLTETVDVDGNGQQFVQYEVFRFRTFEPHSAADKDWMLGVAGPFVPGADPYDRAPATFSRLTPQDDGVSPEEEVRWVHGNIYPRV